MKARTAAEAQKAYDAIDGVKNASDKLIPIPVFGGVGIDGVLAILNATGVGSAIAVPADVLYTLGAGGYILSQGVKGRASTGTLLRSAAYIGVDAVTSGVPWLGGFLDLFFRGHAFAARAIQKDLERTLYVDGRFADARASGAHDGHVSAMRTEGKRRIVYLGD